MKNHLHDIEIFFRHFNNKKSDCLVIIISWYTMYGRHKFSMPSGEYSYKAYILFIYYTRISENRYILVKLPKMSFEHVSKSFDFCDPSLRLTYQFIIH